MARVTHIALKRHDTVAEIGRWSVPVSIDWREWDDEFVVRVDDTATTYVLSALAGHVLKAMREGATYVDEIARRVFANTHPLGAASAALAAAFAEPVGEMEDVLAALTELEALGLARVDLN